MFVEKMTEADKIELKALCNDCKIFQLTESEAKKEKEKTKDKIKAILDKYGYNAKETIDIYKIDYEEQEKTSVDTEAMKACGIYDKFLKKQTVKPLTIR